MALKDQRTELARLVRAFEEQASQFPDARLSTYLIAQDGPVPQRQAQKPNHAIMLWQYYGLVETEDEVAQMVAHLQDSDLQWGMRGAQLTSFALIEGSACPVFVRMAQRAGALFDSNEAATIKSRVLAEICTGEHTCRPSAKSTAVTNDNPLAIWLNFLLHHLSLTHPGRERRQTIEPDPFSLSLLALERLAADLTIAKADHSIHPLQDVIFRVALSFAGEQRVYVSHIVDALRPALGPDAVFYDFDYQAQLARPNLDTLLQRVYRDQSQLVVVCLCKQYAEKSWCGLEWRAVRDIIKAKGDAHVMFVRFDDAAVEGLLSIDGYIDARSHTPQEVAELIILRLARTPSPGHSRAG